MTASWRRSCPGRNRLEQGELVVQLPQVLEDSRIACAVLSGSEALSWRSALRGSDHRARASRDATCTSGPKDTQDSSERQKCCTADDPRRRLPAPRRWRGLIIERRRWRGRGRLRDHGSGFTPCSGSNCRTISTSFWTCPPTAARIQPMHRAQIKLKRLGRHHIVDPHRNHRHRPLERPLHFALHLRRFVGMIRKNQHHHAALPDRVDDDFPQSLPADIPRAISIGSIGFQPAQIASALGLSFVE